MKKAGFTLIELLTVTVILAILAAILFPLMARAKAEALQKLCAANLHSAQLGSSLYQIDYDERFAIPNQNQDNSNSKNDRTWVQLTLPYLKNFDIFTCPSDYSVRPAQNALFDEDLVPGDTLSRYYQASQRSDIGYNYLYLSPVSKVGGQWVASPRSPSEISLPSQTFQFVDSVYETRGQVPVGGGNYLVIPPCRKLATPSGDLDSFTGSRNIPAVFAAHPGWSDPSSGSYIYGSAWPWHQGRINVIYTDGHLGIQTVDQLYEGCNPVPDWQGYITDPGRYKWAIQE